MLLSGSAYFSNCIFILIDACLARRRILGLCWGPREWRTVRQHEALPASGSSLLRH
jgi:hypothetical protein